MLESCPFCRNPGEEVKAHIIPQALFKDISEDNATLNQREIGRHRKRIPIGVYDRTIWCTACEKKYGRWDDYAVSILRTPLEKFDRLSFAYEMEIEKQKEIMLFFISLLWRASKSNQRLYANVSIGPHADIARKIIISESSKELDRFSTILSCSGEDKLLMAEPVPVRYDGVNFYKFFLGRIMADIKVDKRPTPSLLLSASIGYSEKISILRVPRHRGVVDIATRICREQITNY